jgi:hypothetical protein
MANLIQIKRSLTTSTPASLANGELAFTANGDVLYVGSNGAVVPVGGKRVPGTLTANQALVTNASSYLDAIKVANATLDKIYANGAFGTSGQVLTSNSTGGVFFATPSVTSTLDDLTDVAVTSASSGQILIANSTGVFRNVSLSGDITVSDTGVVSISADATVLGTDTTGNYVAEITAGNGLSGNAASEGATPTIAVVAGGGIVSNSTGVFANVDNSTLELSSGSIRVKDDGIALGTKTTGNYVATITAGNGLSGNATTEGSAPTIAVVAGSGIASNSTGVFVVAGDGITSNSSGVFVTDGDGLSVNSTGVHVGAGNGLSVNATAVAVVANNGLASNSSGVFVVAGNGVASNSTGVHVVAGTGVVSNATGVHIGQAVGTTDNVTFANVSVSNTLSVTGFSDLANSDIADVKIRGSNVASGSFEGNLLDLGLGALTLNGGNYGVEIKYSNNRTNYFTTTFNPDSGAILAPANINAASFTVGTNFIANSTLVTVDKDITINGNTTVGSNSSDTLVVNGRLASNIIPSANITYSLGSDTLRFYEIHAQNTHSEFLYVDKDVSISGNLVVSGSLVTINVATLAVTDSLIQLASNNTTSDTLDIGFFGNYQVSGGAHEHAGLFRDASTDTFKLFKGLQDAPTTTVDTSGAGYTTASLEAFLSSSALVSNSTAVTLTANSTVAVNMTANSLTLTTALVGTSGGTGLSSYTAEDILVANSSNGFRKLGIGSDGFVLQSNGTALIYSTLDGGTF